MGKRKKNTLREVHKKLRFWGYVLANPDRYIFIYIDEGVRPVAWQQCKHSLFDVREREGC